MKVPPKRQFWVYCGFAVVLRSSSDWVRDQERWVRARVAQSRGLNFNHNRLLKAIFQGRGYDRDRSQRAEPCS
jgi:hypothetical protein